MLGFSNLIPANFNYEFTQLCGNPGLNLLLGEELADARTIGDTCPKFLNDIRFFKLNDGVLVDSDKGSLFLSGRSLHPLFRALETLLNGTRPLREICDGLRAEQAAVLQKLVRFLMNAGVMQDFSSRFGSSRTSTHAFAATMRVVEHLCPNPGDDFGRFRAARILLVGEGNSFDTCGASLLRMGLENLMVCSTSSIPLRTNITAACNELSTLGCHANVLWLYPADQPVPCSSIRQVDLALYCTDGLVFNDFKALSYLCSQNYVSLLSGCTADELAVIGPAIHKSCRGCWLCGLYRILEEVDPQWNLQFHRHLNSGSQVATNAHLAFRLGRNLAFEAFKFFVAPERMQANAEIIFYKSHSGRITGSRRAHALLRCHGLNGFCENWS